MPVQVLRAAVLAAAGASGWLGAPASALEFWDGRVEVHGFYETRLAFGMEDFDASKEVDMYSFLNVLDVEVEADLASDGWGPFDMVSAFARVEVKYDCVWNHACGLFENVNAFGNHPRQLPHRVLNARRPGWASSQQTFDQRPWWFDDRQHLTPGRYYDLQADGRRAMPINYGYLAGTLFGASPGPDGVLGDMRDIRDGDPFSGLPGDDDAGLYLFERTNRCKAGTWGRKDSSPSGYQTRELPWSIDGCDIEPLRWTQRVANPFRDFANFGAQGDVNPVLQAINGPADDGIPDATALPLRPGAENPAGRRPNGEKWESQGLFLPNYRVRNEIRRGSFDTYDQNFSLNELQWNRGASQQQTKELRELYLDLEMFANRLWLRVGKQTIVWGKTELFRNQDQWNPVDIAIGPLAPLEEARIALWALRGVWSFYEVGPFQDVRTELVVLYDKFEPTDVGRCGEPFVPRVACDKTYGLWAHGEQGAGLAGEIRPDDPWDSFEGIEVGGRLEFRWERFSFALSDYWGYNDTPYTSILFQYDRNVDPLTGRPRHTESRGRCTTGDPTLEPDCLAPGNPLGDVVEIHSINQSQFAWACAGTVGAAPAVDPAACAFTLFNSGSDPGLGVPFARAVGSILAGSAQGAARLSALLGDVGSSNPITGPGGALDTALGVTTPLVALAPPANEDPDAVQVLGGLDRVLATQQEALLGCGDFYFTDCDGLTHEGPDGLFGTSDDTPIGGIDLANADASVVFQSFPWFEGTKFNPFWDTTDPTLPQPGTVDAAFNDGPGGGVDAPDSRPGEVETGPAGSRFENGTSYVLPGAHYDPAAFAGVLANAATNGVSVDPWVLDDLAGYDPSVDGTVCPGGVCKTHPFTGQVWSSEMAVLSWNLLMMSASLGAVDDAASRDVLDRNQPLALGRCSLRQPQYCSFVSGFAAQARNTSSSIRAGGNGRFGRRNLVWGSVGDVALRYQKRNILGFSTDFAEDTTKSSWGVEFTWVDDSLTANGDDYDELSSVDEYNLTLSADRPTFINFLNANRTFLLNTQLFTSYIRDYDNQMPRDGPWTFLWLFNVGTGYFQDRFLANAVVVFDLRSQSAAFLPSVQYRLTENFSITVGATLLAGRYSSRKMPVNQFSAFDEDNLNDTIYFENGVSPARDLDSFYARIRYTF
jgi:hypothetical protein